jgi:hypothetical protein
VTEAEHVIDRAGGVRDDPRKAIAEIRPIPRSQLHPRPFLPG